jgi:hypothetical protein
VTPTAPDGGPALSTTTSPARATRREVVRRFTRRGAYQDTKVLLALMLLPAATAVGVLVAPGKVPFSSLAVPLVLGSLLLTPRHLPWFVGWCLVALAVCTAGQQQLSARTWSAVGVQVLMCLIVLLFSLRRSRLGVASGMGESMFVDLRDRILAQGGIPPLPDGWHVDRALRSAGGTPFAGDFLVATRPVPDRLDIVVVDVSGKGEEAGTRALQLSGVFGGLLGAVPPEQFLPAANDYLLRQDWAEGFATAVHLSVHLADGSYEVRTAGHPPAVQRIAATGHWSVLESEGPVLGLMENAVFAPAVGRLADADRMLLYTDGMVEEPRQDIEIGIDRMVTEAEATIEGPLEGSARRLVEAVGSKDDDRALVVVARS